MRCKVLVSTGDYVWALSDAIAGVLSEYGVDAVPIAGDLPAELPAVSVQVEAMSGDQVNPGVAMPIVRVSSRCLTESGVTALAEAVSGALQVLDSRQVQGVATIVGVTPVSVPYPSTDPRNAKFYVVRQTVQLTVKMQEI